MAKRYGLRPSEFLEGELKAYQFDILAAEKGIDAEIKAQEKAHKEALRKRRRGK